MASDVVLLTTMTTANRIVSRTTSLTYLAKHGIIVYNSEAKSYFFTRLSPSKCNLRPPEQKRNGLTTRTLRQQADRIFLANAKA